MSASPSGGHRRCSKCLRVLSVDSFDFRDKAAGKRKSRCRDCVREYSREHYRENRDVYIERAKAGNRAAVARKHSIVAELKTRPCADCGGSFPPECMEFDHRSGRMITGRDSPEAIANMKGDATGMPRFLAELAKCDLVCRNCHAIRTHARRRGAGP